MFVISRESISTVMNKGVNICCKEVTTQVLEVVMSLVHTLKNQRVILSYILPLLNFLPQKPLTFLVYLSPFVTNYFSELHFSPTYKMYMHLFMTLYGFLIDIDLKVKCKILNASQFEGSRASYIHYPPLCAV